MTSIDEMTDEELLRWAARRIAMAPVLDEFGQTFFMVTIPTENDRYRSEYERIFGHE